MSQPQPNPQTECFVAERSKEKHHENGEDSMEELEAACRRYRLRNRKLALRCFPKRTCNDEGNEVWCP